MTTPNINPISEFSSPKEKQVFHSAPPEKPLITIFNDQGFLTDEGKYAVLEFEKEVRSLLSTGKDDNEVRIIGGILSKMIGDQVSNRILKMKGT